ncbi:hypothetical protein H4R33_000846 [Dimargaris cristalligena]|nr:hypothetical protein H4R33_000846 [Dimargaris cristalligena]
MPPKAKNSGTLGKAIIRDRFKGRTRPIDGDTTLHTVDVDDGPSWTRLQSVTQEGDLDAFLRTAELAGTEFTAERQNIRILGNQNAAVNPFLINSEQEKALLERHAEHHERLTVPRRPHWDHTTSRTELHRAEQESFLDWRRELAHLEDTEGLLLTPFERNLEVWRQLWRVIERSSLIVQIVDARNPLFFRSTDLEKYVKEVDPRKENLLLVNKADMLTDNQRRHWARYFKRHQIAYLFFSAKVAAETLESALEAAESTDEDTEATEAAPAPPAPTPLSAEEAEIHVLSVDELVDILKAKCPKANTSPTASVADSTRKINIGLVGYPNVGKSSTINALVGAKRVAVGATPGKTKHFQTLPLDDDTILCDCPGLVFPSFATTAADMICNGVLPIDQMREYIGPAGLVAQRIPKWVLEAIYGMEIQIKPIEEGGTGEPTAEELLVGYAVARGLTRSGQGNPDESRAARHMLKDYVNGKLLFCIPPPIGESDDSDAPVLTGEAFNAELYDPQVLIKRTHHLVEMDDGQFTVKAPASNRLRNSAVTSTRVQTMDARFFDESNKTGRYGASKKGQIGHQQSFQRVQLYSGQQRVDDQGRPIDSNSPLGRASVAMAGLSLGTGPNIRLKKGKKQGKQRSGKGCDDLY